MKGDKASDLPDCLFLFMILSPPPSQLFSCHSTYRVRAKWTRNDHNNITSSYTSTGELTFFVVLILFMDVFRVLFDPCSCLFMYFWCQRVNIIKTLVSLMSFAWLSCYWLPLGDHRNIVKCSDPHGQAWSQVIRRISSPKHSFIHRKCN